MMDDGNDSMVNVFSVEPTPKQFTVLVVKPDAVQAGKVDEIIEKVGWSYASIKCLIYYSNCLLANYCKFVLLFQVEGQGYQVLAKEERQLTKEEAAEFYKQHEGSVSFFSNHSVFLSSLNNILLCLGTL